MCHVAERWWSIGVPELLEKIQWNATTFKEAVLQNIEQKHAKRVWEDIGWQNLGQYYHICVKSDTLLFAVFEKFKNKCLEILWTRFCLFPSRTCTVWQKYLKKMKVELKLITDADLLLKVEKASELEYAMPYINMK